MASLHEAGCDITPIDFLFEIKREQDLMARFGLVDVPGCGKTTVFNALTAAGASVFDGAEMHRATVEVPDSRVQQLVSLYQPKKVVPATLDIVDIPGLGEGSTAEGDRGSRLLTHVQEADVLVHVIRCFHSPSGDAPDPTPSRSPHVSQHGLPLASLHDRPPAPHIKTPIPPLAFARSG